MFDFGDAPSMRASLLAIGTELTQGQIVNRNAAWISERLTELNIPIMRHLTVADDRIHIIKTMQLLELDSELILITGGLGPTTDDFTRDVLAEWSGHKMIYDQDSWTWIEERMKQVGIPVAPSNKQQCYFPEGATIYPNPKGSARGYSFRKQNIHVFVFPGPPHELEAVWDEGAGRDIRASVPLTKPTRLLRWGVVGRSEAELGENVERILAGSGLQTGYRAHAPYVEVKVWCSEDELVSKQKWLTELDAYLKPNTLVKNGEDIAVLFLDQLLQSPQKKITIVDGCTYGILTERLLPILRKPKYRALIPNVEILTNPVTIPEGTNVYSVSEMKPSGEWKLSRNGQPQTIKSPYSRPGLEDRNRKYVCEISLSEWIKIKLHS